MSALYEIALPPALLKQGFWIYIWRIRIKGQRPAFYVGMTGDTGSYRAQSPLNRLSAHLGHNKRSNALRRYLRTKGIDIESCNALEFAAYGPIGSVPSEKAEYRIARARIAALEKRLWQDMEAAGMDMLNQCPACKTPHDAKISETIRSAFAPFLKSRS